MPLGHNSGNDAGAVGLPCDSGMDGDTVARAEMLWANLPTRVPWTSLATHEKALVCHTLARLTNPAEPSEAMIEAGVNALHDTLDLSDELLADMADNLALAATRTYRKMTLAMTKGGGE